MVMVFLEFGALLGLMLGAIGTVASPSFRAGIANIASEITHHISNAADDAYMFLRRVLVITTAATILSLSIMFHFGAMNSLMTIIVIFMVLFFLFGEIDLERAGWYAAIAFAIWLLSLLFSKLGSPTLATVLAIVAILGAGFLLVLSSGLRGLFSAGPSSGVIGILLDTGDWFAAVLTTIFSAWMIAMLTAVLLFQLGHHQDVYAQPMLLITILLLGGLLQFASHFMHMRWLRGLATVGYVAIMLMLILPLVQYIPGPWQSLAHYSAVREHAWSTGRVKAIAATGRNYYEVSAPTAAYVCNCRLIPSDSTKPAIRDSLQINSLPRLDTLPEGTKLVSFGWRPTEHNGTMMLGLHRNFAPGQGIGYDMSTIYLVNTADLADAKTEDPKMEMAPRRIAQKPETLIVRTVLNPAAAPEPISAKSLPEPEPEETVPQKIVEPVEMPTAQIDSLKFELIGCFDRLDAIICKTWVTNTGAEDSEVSIKAYDGSVSTRAITDAGDTLAPESLPAQEVVHSARKIFEVGFQKQPSTTRLRAVQLAVQKKRLFKENGKLLGSTSKGWFVEFTDVAIRR